MNLIECQSWTASFMTGRYHQTIIKYSDAWRTVVATWLPLISYYILVSLDQFRPLVDVDIYHKWMDILPILIMHRMDRYLFDRCITRWSSTILFFGCWQLIGIWDIYIHICSLLVMISLIHMYELLYSRCLCDGKIK